jgi:hypothetical protein
VDVSAPTVATLTPADNSSGFPFAADLSLTFNENVSLINGGTITIFKPDNNPFETFTLPNAAVTVSGATVTINPTTPLESNTSYYVQVAANTVQDAATTPNAFSGITDTTTWNFTTVDAPFSPPKIDTQAINDDFVAFGDGDTVDDTANDVRQILVNFSSDVKNGGGGEDDAANVNNYRLIHAGADGVINTTFTSTFCKNGTVDANDIQIVMTAMHEDAPVNRTTLTIQGGSALDSGVYVLLICGSTSIVDAVTGLPLDGNGDGTEGDDARIDFRVAALPSSTTTGTGTSNDTGSTTGPALVTGGADVTGDGVADVISLPATGETPLWIVALRGLALGLVVILSGAGAVWMIRRRRA